MKQDDNTDIKRLTNQNQRPNRRIDKKQPALWRLFASKRLDLFFQIGYAVIAAGRTSARQQRQERNLTDYQEEHQTWNRNFTFASIAAISLPR